MIAIDDTSQDIFQHLIHFVALAAMLKLSCTFQRAGKGIIIPEPLAQCDFFAHLFSRVYRE